MIATLALLLLADVEGQTTLPRQREQPPQQQQRDFEGTPTDPLFDKPLVATDDPTFVRNALEATRQGEFDAQSAGTLKSPVGETAEVLAAHYGKTRDELEALSRRKRWPLPAEVADRTQTVKQAAPTRLSADFIVSQIAAHQTAMKQYRAQIEGTQDPEVKRTLRNALAGYQRNLELLLKLEYVP